MQQSSSLSGRKSRPGHSAYWAYLFSMLLLAGLFGMGTNVPTAQAFQAANPNVKMTARSLFQGYFKYGDWLPIEVNLQNFGEALDLRVQVTVVNRINGTNYNTIYQRETNLSERANKRVLLYVIPYAETPNASRSVSYDTFVKLMYGTRQLAEERVSLIPSQPTDYLVGAVTQDPNALNGLSNLKVGGQQRTRVASVSVPLADIPDRSDGLRSFDALIFSEVNTESLSNEQRQSVLSWVEAGGQLILMGGNGWGRVKAAFSPSLLPLDINNYANVTNLNGLVSPNGDEVKTSTNLPRPATMARGQVTKEARLLSYLQDGANVVPVAAERRLGSGRIVVTTIDLAMPPLVEWNGGEKIWQELFSFNFTPYLPLYAETNPQIKNAQEMLQNVSSVPELRLPDITPYFAILFVYLLLIAPLNYLILKKVGRLELAWVSIPLVGVVFLVFTLNYANSQPPGQVLISQMSVVQTSPGQENAQVRSYAAVFSPEERRYDISPNIPNTDSPVRTLLTPLNRTSVSPTDAENTRTVVQGDKPRLENFQIGQWNAQGLAVETNLSARGYQVAANLYYENDKIVGTIRNNTNTSLKNTVLMLGDYPVKFRDNIEPGEIVNVDFALPLPTAAVLAYCSNSYSSSSISSGTTPAERIATVLRQDRRDDKLAEGRISFLRKLYEIGRYSPVNAQHGLDLIGWMEQNPVPLVVDGVTSQSKSSQVLITRLPVAFETSSGDGRLFLPAPAFRPESAINNTGQSALTTRTDRTDQVCISRGNVTVQFRLPVDQGNFKVKNLALYVNSYSTSAQRAPTLPDSFEMFDFQARSWQPLSNINNSAVGNNNNTNSFATPPTPVKNVIENAARFADPATGRILLRMNYSAAPLLVVQHGLEVEGARN